MIRSRTRKYVPIRPSITLFAGLVAIILIGAPTFSNANAEERYEDFRQLEQEFREKFHELEEEYRQKFMQLEREFEQKRMDTEFDTDGKRLAIEHEYQDKFLQLDLEFEEKRLALEEEIWQSEDLTPEQTREMFEQLYAGFEEQRRALEDQMYQEMSSFEHSGNEFNDLYYDFEQQRIELEHEFDQKRQQLEHEFDRKRMELEQEFRDDYNPYLNDEGYSEIKELEEKILASVSMDEIQSLWMAQDFDGLRDLILSRTDLTDDEVTLVFEFFKKYEGDHRDYDDYREGDHRDNDDYGERDGYTEYDEYEDRNYQEFDKPNDTLGEINILLQRIDQLEEENQELRDYLGELEQKLTDLNLIVMQQVQIIYEWVLNQ